MEICIFFLVFFGDATVSLGEYILHSLATRSFEQRPQPGARRQQQQQRASFWKARDVDGSGSRRIFLECCVCDRKISRSKKGRSRRSVLLGGDRAHFVPARCQLDIVLFGITLRFDTGSPCGNAGKGPCFSVWYRKTCFYSRVTPKKHRLLPPTAAVLLRGGPSTWRVDGR